MARGAVSWFLLLVPTGWLLAWAAARLAGRPRRPWRWGTRSLGLPLAAISLWAGASLWQGLQAESIKALAAFVLVWLLYLYLINEQTALAAPLALVVLVQGTVAVLQVWKQADLGLWWLGERQLDPMDGGLIVLLVGGQRWIRGYGLTGGPNALGASLAFLVFYLLPHLLRGRGWRLWAWSLTISIGTAGLLASFSRSAALALALGLAAWAALAWRRRSQPLFAAWDRRRWLAVALPVAFGLAYLLLYAPALTSRFAQASNPLEARSIGERERDAGVALALVAKKPLLGVGLGNFEPAARALDASARLVHNVPLLISAELGIIGALLWLWLALAGLWRGWRSRQRPGWLFGLWVVFLAPGLVGPWWLTVSWRVGVLFALLLAASDTVD